jgi:hypothetical protein
MLNCLKTSASPVLIFASLVLAAYDDPHPVFAAQTTQMKASK